MATIKQLKIGSTNYDIKALNASNQNQASAVVRDIQYGTSAPSGGSAGQMYLQYNTDTTANNYVYAEDDVGSSSANVIDNYYSKSEVDAMIADKFNWKVFGSHTGNDNYEITPIWDAATEFYVVVSKYYQSGTTANPVFELQCHVLKQQIEDDWASAYNTGKIVFVPAGNRWNANGGTGHTWNALFRFHNGNDKKYIQLNELFCGTLASSNQNAVGYYVVYWR